MEEKRQKTMQWRLLLWAAVGLGFLSIQVSANLPPPTKIATAISGQHRKLLEEGISLHDQRRYAEAIKKYDEILAENGDCVEALYEKASSHLEAGDCASASLSAKKGAQFISEIYSQFCTLLGNCLDEQGKVAEALEWYASAVETQPDDFMARFNFAVTLAKQGRKTEARDQLKHAVVQNPNHPSSHLLMGTLLEEEGYHIPAILTLERFLMLEPSTERSLMALAVIAKAKETFKAPAESRRQRKAREKAEKEGMQAPSPPKKTDEGVYLKPTIALAVGVIYGQTYGGEGLRLEIATKGVFFKSLGEPDAADRTMFFAQYYGPYFSSLEAKGLTETFTVYTRQVIYSDGYPAWAASNQNELNALLAWSRGYLWPKEITWPKTSLEAGPTTSSEATPATAPVKDASPDPAP